MLKRLIVALLTLFLFFGGLFGWKYYLGQQKAAQAAMPPPPATVSSTEVLTETWQPSLRAVGSLVAVNGIDVTTEVAGQVESIKFKSGQRIKRGEILVQLGDSVDKAELNGLIAALRLAELQYKRASELIQTRNVSRSDFDEARANLDNAKAQLASKRAVIRKKSIRAPFTGLLGIRQVDIGEYLAPGARIVPLQALEPIYVDYSLPERYFSLLHEGQDLSLTVMAYAGKTFKGRISAINPGIDRGTRNVRLRGALNNPQQNLRPGMFAEVQTKLPARSGILTLPRTSIAFNPYGDVVYVITEKDGQLVVQRRQVETGETREGRIEIVKGLNAGEQVVNSGQMKLRNGQPVVIENSVEFDDGLNAR